MTTIRIALAEDQEIIREGLSRVLGDFLEFQIVASSRNGKELIEAIKEKEVDLVLLDEEMPEMNGLQTLSFLSQFHPNVKVIFLTIAESIQSLRRYLTHGAWTVLSKSVGIDVLVNAIRQVYTNKRFYHGLLTPEFLLEVNSESEEKESLLDKKNVLTEREAEIVVLICKGRSNGEMSLELSLSQRTVENHRMRISKKTQCRTTAELVVYAIKNNVYAI
ncbi:MAG: response regulator transcription factor [Flavobacteriales bacterium]|nr:response regulator transcription factor [Flavobacteriales bacterium]